MRSLEDKDITTFWQTEIGARKLEHRARIDRLEWQDAGGEGGIIATPVSYHDRVYGATGRDSKQEPKHSPATTAVTPGLGVGTSSPLGILQTEEPLRLTPYRQS